MKAAWIWLKGHAVILGLAIGAIASFLLLRPRKADALLDALKVEREVRDAKTDAKVKELELGRQEAAQKIVQENAGKLAALDRDQYLEALRLGDDPQALSEFLVRAGKKKG